MIKIEIRRVAMGGSEFWFAINMKKEQEIDENLEEEEKRKEKV